MLLIFRYSTSLIMVIITTGYFIMECIRLMFPSVNKIFAQQFRGLLREKERNNFTGSFFYLVGATVSIVFFRYSFHSFYSFFFCNHHFSFFFLFRLPFHFFLILLHLSHPFFYYSPPIAVSGIFLHLFIFIFWIITPLHF